MRLSAVLVAVLTVSATFGLSNSANGQTSYSESAEKVSAAIPPVEAIESPVELTENPPENRVVVKASKIPSLKILAAAPARGENDREPSNRLTETSPPIATPSFELKPDLESHPRLASTSPNALPDAKQDDSPVPPSEAAVLPASVALDQGKQDESGGKAKRSNSSN